MMQSGIYYLNGTSEKYYNGTKVFFSEYIWIWDMGLYMKLLFLFFF